METFRKELEGLINKNSIENGSQTPDYILAEYLIDCLTAFDRATNLRDVHYNIKHYKDGELVSPKPPPPIENQVMEKIADAIGEELFINGAGEKAKRLVLELEDGSNGGGWGKKPMIDIILKHLKRTNKYEKN